MPATRSRCTESGAADSVAHPGLWPLYRLLGQLAKAVPETALNQEITRVPRS